jgi:hypothetical protein
MRLIITHVRTNYYLICPVSKSYLHSIQTFSRSPAGHKITFPLATDLIPLFTLCSICRSPASRLPLFPHSLRTVSLSPDPDPMSLWHIYRA